jgi:predicted metal-dependent hydrolase
MFQTVSVAGKDLPVIITEKNMKTVRLKVFPSGEIRLSVPYNTPIDWIISFLKKKEKWIEEKIDQFVQTKAIEKEEHIRSGTSTRILGRQLIIRVEAANQKRIEKCDSTLTIYTTNAKDQADIDRQFNNWWQRASKECFISILEYLYPIIRKHGIEKPDVIVKKMSTLWGSCSRKMARVNLNYYLYKASLPCIEYVILHELVHFLYPHHNKDFYEFIAIHMPDWKERKRQLDYEVVLGV